MTDKDEIIEIEPFEIVDKSKPKKPKLSETSTKPQMLDRSSKKFCVDCKKRESEVDMDKDKDIDQLKIFLRSKSIFIKDLHFKKGFSLQAIFLEIQRKYKKRVCYGKWMTNKNKKHLFDLMKPKLRDFVLFKILKYADWDEYKKTVPKLNARARYTHGFTDKLKREIKKRDGNRCQRCGRTTGLDVHHIDGDRFNNEPENLITLCKECHKKND
jgi:hypothetical protein